MNNIHISSTAQSISASCNHDDINLSVASADNIGEYWYISRVMVREKYRGSGIGSKLLNAIIEEVKKYGGNIVVCPGGYDEDLNRQMNFYKKNGFIEGDQPGMLTYVQQQ